MLLLSVYAENELAQWTGAMRKASTNEPEALEEWSTIRTTTGCEIDPENVEVEWFNGYLFDPYGVSDLPEEYQCVGPLEFARRPGSAVWVWFGDLPPKTRERIRHRVSVQEPRESIAPAEVLVGAL